MVSFCIVRRSPSFFFKLGLFTNLHPSPLAFALLFLLAGWMIGYYSVAVWSSIWMMTAPLLPQAGDSSSSSSHHHGGGARDDDHCHERRTGHSLTERLLLIDVI